MAEPPLPPRGAQRWLVVMAKEPRAGSVKTRLAKDIGHVAATNFYRKTISNVVRRLGSDPRWHTLIAVTQDTSLYSSVWPLGSTIFPQGEGDLGVRMQRVFYGLPPGPVVIIGTDIPEIMATYVADAFRALGSHDAVLGPSEDGGYWLLGLRRTPKVRQIFANVRWSSPHTMDDTLANLGGLRVAMLETLCDVDDGQSHRRLSAAASRSVLPLARRNSPRG